MPENSCEAVPFAPPDIGEEEIAAVVETMRGGWLTTGPNAAAFEREFAQALLDGFGETGDTAVPGFDSDVQAVALNSATAGLHLAVEALGIGPGDEVIVPTWTFTATAEVVRYVGADPVIVDVDPGTLNLDLQAARAAITARTRALVPVHFAGLPVDRRALADLAAEHDLAVVEDAAHAFPVRSSGLPVGLGASDAVVFSFYATKTMTTGEGGMLVTARDDIARRARTMRLHGISRDVFDRYSTAAMSRRDGPPSWAYEIVAPGFKYNLTDPAAAMGRVQLRRAVAMRANRRRIAARYHEAFADLPVVLPAGEPDRADAEHAWHLYVLRLTDDAPLGRDAFIDALARRRVGASVHFIPLHRHPYWRGFRRAEAGLPIAEDAFARAVSLPIFSAMSQEQVRRVVQVVREVLGGG